MPQIHIKDSESFDLALRRFRRTCDRSGIMYEMRKRVCYEKPTTIRKRKANAARRRHHHKRLQREQRWQARPF